MKSKASALFAAVILAFGASMAVPRPAPQIDTATTARIIAPALIGGWTDRETLMSTRRGIGSFDSIEFSPEGPQNPETGNTLQVVAVLADNKLQNPSTHFEIALERFVVETNQWARIGLVGFVGNGDVPAGSRPGIGVDEPYWGTRLRATVVKFSNEDLSLKLRAGQDD